MQPSLRGMSAGGGREGTSSCRPMQGGPVGPRRPQPRAWFARGFATSEHIHVRAFRRSKTGRASGARSTMGSAGSQQGRGGCLFSGAPVRDGIEPDLCFSSGN